MDRISALRNVEEAIRAFENGEAGLADTERRVTAVLRTYATELDDEERAIYRASGDPPADGTVVVAASEAAAADRVRDLCGGDADDGGGDADPAFDLERL